MPRSRKGGKLTGSRLSGELKETILGILRPYGVRRVAIFGSYARGEAGPGSDIDILVRFARPKSLFELVGIEEELEQALHLKVDLLTEKAVSPYLIDAVRHDEVVILG
jgi:predicted nucleotidyltransferase